MGKFTIKKVMAREILDSRGNPTVEAEVLTEGGFGRASVPSGASTGTYEAIELRDGGRRYHGKGVLKACRIVNEVIAPAVIGMDSRSLSEIDVKMIQLDGTENKSKLGANAILGVSLAVAKAAADTAKVPLFEYLSKGSRILPVPLMNIINGGKHAGNNLAIQEFMIVPAGAVSIRDALRMGSEVYMELKKILKDRYGPLAANVGDEGGFAPPISNAVDAFGPLVDAIEKAGYEKEVKLAIDPAASSFFKDGEYSVDGKTLSPGELLDYYSGLVKEYPIISIEDPFEEDDYGSFVEITKRLGSKIQIVGDDLFVTNMKRLRKGVGMGAANSILLKVNQIGTLTESIEVAKFAVKSGYAVVVSHRSGETEDCYIADLAVALGSGQIKTGAPARGERVSKYNQLLRIEELLGSRARYLGLDAFKHR
ncbi:MAG: phosphopyruvate hydratase [Candidatus Verstraetearchaeota archaeon]|nr:phosphopyruvate hydratase [Candidatus Verstraetearchaeota archaeon]